MAEADFAIIAQRPGIDRYDRLARDQILSPLYRTENRRLPAASGKTIAVAAQARQGSAELTAPTHPAIRRESAAGTEFRRRGRPVSAQRLIRDIFVPSMLTPIIKPC
jgi:hypothetical protein